MKKISDKGLIDVKRRDIKILNNKELEELAEHGRNMP